MDSVNHEVDMLRAIKNKLTRNDVTRGQASEAVSAGTMNSQ